MLCKHGNESERLHSVELVVARMGECIYSFKGSEKREVLFINKIVEKLIHFKILSVISVKLFPFKAES